MGDKRTEVGEPALLPGLAAEVMQLRMAMPSNDRDLAIQAGRKVATLLASTARLIDAGEKVAQASASNDPSVWAEALEELDKVLNEVRPVADDFGAHEALELSEAARAVA
jgi:vacuolar-type H+-ATPase catalytic subunit A/Vma1